MLWLIGFLVTALVGWLLYTNISIIVKLVGEGQLPAIILAGLSLLAGVFSGFAAGVPLRKFGGIPIAVSLLLPLAVLTGWIFLTHKEALGALGVIAITIAVIALMVFGYTMMMTLFRKKT